MYQIQSDSTVTCAIALDSTSKVFILIFEIIYSKSQLQHKLIQARKFCPYVNTSVSIACILPHQGSNKSLKLCCGFPLVIIVINFLQLNNLQMSQYRIRF